MKRLLLSLIIAVLCISFGSLTIAHQSSEGMNPAPKDVLSEVCKVLEPSVAKIDAARAIQDKPSREKKYAEARAIVEPVLEKHRQTALLAIISDYITYTEFVATMDPTDPKFQSHVTKRLEARSILLGVCESYTSSR